MERAGVDAPLTDGLADNPIALLIVVTLVVLSLSVAAFVLIGATG